MHRDGVMVRLAMTANATGQGLPAGARRPAGFWAPALSLLCAIHCAGMALLAPSVPAVAALAGFSWVEPPLIALSAASAWWQLRRARAHPVVWAIVALALGAAAWGLRNERETVMQAGLGASGGVQLILAFAARKRRAAIGACCGPDDCRPSPPAGG